MDYPANWDKNLALAAERLLNLGGGHHGPESLLSNSIHHFSRYIEREPTDPQNEAIRSAIRHLSKERDRLRDLHRKTQHKPVWNCGKCEHSLPYVAVLFEGKGMPEGKEYLIPQEAGENIRGKNRTNRMEKNKQANLSESHAGQWNSLISECWYYCST